LRCVPWVNADSCSVPKNALDGNLCGLATLQAQDGERAGCTTTSCRRVIGGPVGSSGRFQVLHFVPCTPAPAPQARQCCFLKRPAHRSGSSELPLPGPLPRSMDCTGLTPLRPLGWRSGSFKSSNPTGADVRS
jgi:hypothetical protein